MAASTPIFLNNVASTISAVASGATTTVTVAAGDGAKFGAVAAGQYIPVVIVDPSTSPETVKEYMWVTGIAGDVLTVTRAAESASTYPAGALAAGLTVAAVASAAALTPNYGGLFGDGSDGAVNMDGTNTFAGFATKSGNTYTLTRDVFATTLIIGASATVKPGPFRFFQTVSWTNNGAIDTSGNAGNANGTAGASLTSAGPLGGAAAGGAGNIGAGTAGNSGGKPGVAGGAGGLGSGGAGGAAGIANAPISGSPFYLAMLRNPAIMLSGVFATNVTATGLQGAPGGGGGGGDGTNKGGGGGSGAGIIAVFAPTIINNGTITANGGNGGSPAAGNCGGGGGGGGGLIVTYSVATVAGSGSTSVTGGTGGTKVGTGVNGSNGSNGQVLNVVLV